MDSVHAFELVLSLLVVVVILTAVAEKIGVPYPIALVLGGLALALIPGLPDVQLNPGLVFILFLPPVLYGAAWMTSWRDFRKNIRPILTLAVGLTLFTTVVVALVAHYLIPGLTLAGGFVLGAIVSPPDAAAATSIAERLHLPRRIVTILEGESLVNDAMGLVLYQFAVAAVVTGAFSMSQAVGQFFYAAFGGIVLGLALGWLAGMLQGRLRHVPAVEILFTILVAFAVYLAAEYVHVSGVLATVTAGLYGGWNSPARLSAETRMQGGAFWGIVIFLLNGLIFILIGLQLRGVLSGLMNQQIWSQLRFFAAVICAVVILVRMVWIFPAAYLPRLFPAIRKKDPMPPPGVLVVIGWTGMRGIVTLAAAMALPVLTNSGEAFPSRDLIVFLAFAVILATLVVQGLTLPPLIRALKLKDDGEAEREERQARIHAARAAIADFESRDAKPMDVRPPDALLESFRTRYQQKLDELLRDQFDAESKEKGTPVQASTLPIFLWIQRIRLDGLGAERRAIIELRDRGDIGDEVLHKIERELDLEESRLK